MRTGDGSLLGETEDCQPPVPTLDLRGLHCPLPVLRTRKALAALDPGACLIVECTDPMAEIDIPHLLSQTGDTLIGIEVVEGGHAFSIRKRST